MTAGVEIDFDQKGPPALGCEFRGVVGVNVEDRQSKQGETASQQRCLVRGSAVLICGPLAFWSSGLVRLGTCKQ